MPKRQSPELQAEFSELVEIMRQLRSPDTGCPWDIEQDFESIAPYTIEEAYEVNEAIQCGSMTDLCEELGDLLLQVVFHAQIAAEMDAFSIGDVIQSINSKMVRRHPHVFDTDQRPRSASEQTKAWEVQKAKERSDKSPQNEDSSALAGVANALPALMRAEKLQKRAARTGFDWTEAEQIFAKLDEEVSEVKVAIADADADAMEDEIGDILFVCANLARRLEVDPERALRRANRKFESRFRLMETVAANDGKDFANLDLDAQETLWTRVKQIQSAALITASGNAAPN